jgi:hypothetical protein
MDDKEQSQNYWFELLSNTAQQTRIQNPSGLEASLAFLIKIAKLKICCCFKVTIVKSQPGNRETKCAVDCG